MLDGRSEQDVFTDGYTIYMVDYRNLDLRVSIYWQGVDSRKCGISCIGNDYAWLGEVQVRPPLQPSLL